MTFDYISCLILQLKLFNCNPSTYISCCSFYNKTFWSVDLINLVHVTLFLLIYILSFFLSFASQRVNGNLNLEWKPLIFRPRTWLKWSLSSPNEFPLKAETDFKLWRTFSSCFAVVFFSATYELFISFSFSSQLHRKRYNLFHILSLNYNLNNIYNKLKEVSFFFLKNEKSVCNLINGHISL